MTCHVWLFFFFIRHTLFRPFTVMQKRTTHQICYKSVDARDDENFVFRLVFHALYGVRSYLHLYGTPFCVLDISSFPSNLESWMNAQCVSSFHLNVSTVHLVSFSHPYTSAFCISLQYFLFHFIYLFVSFYSTYTMQGLLFFSVAINFYCLKFVFCIYRLFIFQCVDRTNWR